MVHPGGPQPVDTPLAAPRLFRHGLFSGEIGSAHCGACGRVVTEDIPWARPRTPHHRVRTTRRLVDPTIRPDHRRNRTTGRLGDRHNDHQPGCCRAAHRCPLRRAHPPRCRRDLLCERPPVPHHRRRPNLGCDPLGREGKNAATLGRFYELLGPERCEKIEAVSMDMAYAYPAATRKATNATICWDPFHVSSCTSTRQSQQRSAGRSSPRPGFRCPGDDARDLRWALLKKPGDHTEAQAAVLKRHQRSHHSIWRAQQLKERFRALPTRQPDPRRRLP